MLTMQRTEIDSKDGQRFLRKVVRETSSLKWDESWTAYASIETDWYWKFMRKVAGQTGCPDSMIEVQTDAKCLVHVKPGMHKPFSDGQEVDMPTPRSARLSDASAAILAKTLLDGQSASIEGSAGSTNSSQHGLAFLSIQARVKGVDYGTITIGSDTLIKDGRQIISGSVDV